MIKYQVEIPDPRNHLFHVVLTIPAHNRDIQLSLPNWIPGSYMIRDFSKNFVSMSARANGKLIDINKVDKSTWHIDRQDCKVIIEYLVFALDLSVRSAHLDTSHAFFNGTSLFLRVAGFENTPHEMSLLATALPETWTVKTGLPLMDTDERGFGRYLAAGYDQLIDCPVDISDSIDISFDVLGKTHYLHLSGDLPVHLDVGKIVADLSRVCREQVALFEGELPVDSYRFLCMVYANSYGGLEHKNSSVLMCVPESLPRVSQPVNKEHYHRFLGLCSHEYLHLWNVKRIKPAVLQDADLSGEAHTRLLWFFEGVTSYYDDLALLRSGCLSASEYLKLLAELLTRYHRTAGRYQQTLSDSSFDAWTKFYKQDANAINAIVSYYTKGAVVALGLDAWLRQHAGDTQLNLDSVMRYLWRSHGCNEEGLAETSIEQQIESLAGKPMQAFFDLCLRSTDDLPVRDWLKVLGIGIAFRPQINTADQGGVIETGEIPDEASSSRSMTLGMQIKPGTTEIASVLNDSPAEKAGLSPGDEVLAIDGWKVKSDNLEKHIQAMPEEPVALHFTRRERLYQVDIQTEPMPDNSCDLFLLTNRKEEFLEWSSSRASNA